MLLVKVQSTIYRGGYFGFTWIITYHKALYLKAYGRYDVCCLQSFWQSTAKTREFLPLNVDSLCLQRPPQAASAIPCSLPEIPRPRTTLCPYKRGFLPFVLSTAHGSSLH